MGIKSVGGYFFDNQHLGIVKDHFHTNINSRNSIDVRKNVRYNITEGR